MSEAPSPAYTRRAVLGSAAGLTALSSLPGASRAARTGTATPTVLTWNAYLGVDLFRLFRAETAGEFRRIAGGLVEGVDPAIYEARADAIAAEIAATDADVLALQEVSLLRTQRPGDFGSADPEPASDVLVDFLSLIESALDDRDLDYEVAAATTTTDVELPADTEAGQVDVRLTDRDVLLIRGDLAVEGTATDTFETALPVPIPDSDRTVPLERGYCAADVTVDGVGFTAVSTHLESVSSQARRRQARELLDALPEGRPVLLGGDLNSGPGTETATYDLLTAEFGDAYADLAPEDAGFTCCQARSLRNEASRLDRRIDALLYRGNVRPTAVARLGHRPEDRVEVELDDGTGRIWPSDHAGVVGTFEVAESTPAPTVTPTPAGMPTDTPTRTPAATDEPTPTAPPTDGTPVRTADGTGPGMGIVAAVGGLSAAALARLRRD